MRIGWIYAYLWAGGTSVEYGDFMGYASPLCELGFFFRRIYERDI